MAQNKQVLAFLKQRGDDLSVSEICTHLSLEVSSRTVRRWLMAWAEKGLVAVTGHTKNRRYAYALSKRQEQCPHLSFLNALDQDLQAVLLEQLRDAWVFTATGIQGSSLQLQDCHQLLNEGITVAEKAMDDHQQVLGFAQAIEVLYQTLQRDMTESQVFECHKTLIHEHQADELLLSQAGKYRTNPMGSYTISEQGEQLYIEYANSDDVSLLLNEWICIANQVSLVGIGVNFDAAINQKTAAKIYAKLHMALVHIHPFSFANGLMARLLANMPLLKAGFPPLIIQPDKRQDYIALISRYQMLSGPLDSHTGLWPRPELLKPFIELCQQQYEYSLALVDEVVVKQHHRQSPLFESHVPV
ncbi:MAG: Fic family protein [Pseudomonadales bacterium]|nr:Fic family protein [Pseudomonadales bacterium]